MITPNYRLAIDFSSVEEIPQDAKERLPYFNALKELIRSEKEKIKAWHRSGAGGREVIQSYTSLIDEVIRHVILSMIRLKKYQSACVLEDFSLVAVGGYGRGELNPLSDIDLLFLIPDKPKSLTDMFIQDALSVFWGFGMEIGHSSRTIKDCVNLAKEDLTIKTSMIETRFLIGDQIIYGRFTTSINKKVLQKGVKKFLNSKLKEKYTRYGNEEGVVCHPEPDIKNGPGGLRDYHNALWASAVRFGVHSFREIGDTQNISPQEIESLYNSVDFSLRVRNELHYLTEKKTDVLSRDIQKDLAAHLGYHASFDGQPVEDFMRDYYLHATNIYNFSENLFEHCLQAQQSFMRVLSDLTKKSLGNGFSISGSTLVYDGDPKKDFKNDKSLVLSALELSRKHSVLPDYQLRRQLRLHKKLIKAEHMKGEEIRNFLFSVLGDGDSEKTLRLMHETEILEQVLPEFGLAHCKVNHDFYHHYTADEHSLRIIRFLEEMESATLSNPTDLVTIYKEYPNKKTLKFAALLQSAGTLSDMDGESGLSGFLKFIGDRLHLKTDEKELLEFLIKNIYEMVETALHQDIHQSTVIQKFAQIVDNQECLAALYLFSYAELRAVAPGTLTAWKKLLLSELYERTSKYLSDPGSLDQHPQATRAGVFKALHGELPVIEIESHLGLMPEDYLMTAHSEEVALHIRLIRSLKDKPFILHHEFNEEGKFYNLTLSCVSGQESFKKLVGALTARSLNILGAHIYLKKDGYVIVSVQVEESEIAAGDNFEIWKEIKLNLSDLFSKKTSLQKMMRSRTRYAGEQKGSHEAIVPRVQVVRETADTFTVIRVEARDHLGMLYKIASVFADFGILIHRAKISTQGDRGIDVFYVSLKDQRVTFQKLMSRFKANMIEVLMIEKLEDVP
ncbi:nucleotidyltransferase domain-containing protein [Nitrospinaceae bacterium]|nr:nucleotidyltransferase domain-containing protein [Nitrospinaceae bacterium]